MSKINEKEDDNLSIEESEDVVATESSPRKRGRKKGVKVGPRPTTWACAAIVDDKCIQEEFQAPEGSSFEELESFSADDAREAFADLYNVDFEDISVKGPYHNKKGGQYFNSSKKRETVSIALPNLTMQRKSATYKGWKGMAYTIEGRDDVVYFMFGEEINPNLDKKKALPTAKTVFKTAIEFNETI
jgi:hypothetical protein